MCVFSDIFSQYIAYPFILLSGVFWWEKEVYSLCNLFSLFSFKFIAFCELRNACLLLYHKDISIMFLSRSLTVLAFILGPDPSLVNISVLCEVNVKVVSFFN